MVYMAGDNNLDSTGAVDLMEMKRVGSTDKINIVVQFDREGQDLATNRYYIRKGGTIARDKIAGLGETNTGDPRVLEDFVAWSVKDYPATHYLLVLWNHGSGWDDSNVYQGDVFSGVTQPVSRKHQTIAAGRGGARGLKPVSLAMTRA